MSRIFFLIIIFVLSSISMFSQIAPIESLNLNIVRTSEQKYKVKIAIMIEFTNCEICIDHINPIYISKFDNIDVDMKIYFHSDNAQQMEKTVKENGWDINVIQDPLGLYAKHFNIKSYPAIVILDESNNQIYNNYLGNSFHILKVLNKIDELASKIVPIETNEYKILKTITFTKGDENYTDGKFIQVYYNDNENYYWLINDKDKSIVIFDSLGKYNKEIQLPYKEHFNYFYPTDFSWLNDSIAHFGDDGRYFIKMNTNTGDTISTFNIKSNKNYNTDTGSFLVSHYKHIEENNSTIFVYVPKGFRKLKSNTPLLLMLDSNYNFVKTFAPSPKWLEEYSMAYTILMENTKVFQNNDIDDNIYFMTGNTNTINIFDKIGNHIKDINLDFSKNYKYSYYINVEYGENYVSQRRELAGNISFIDLIKIENNLINVFYKNINFADVSNTISTYYYEQFSLDGKRMIAHPIQYATNEKAIYFKNNKLITLYINNSIITMKWYEFL